MARRNHLFCSWFYRSVIQIGHNRDNLSMLMAWLLNGKKDRELKSSNGWHAYMSQFMTPKAHVLRDREREREVRRDRERKAT